MFIYKLINKINGKYYIGKTVVAVDIRIKRHFKAAKNGSKLYIHNAIRKYGQENFVYEILDTANTKEELSKKEKYWIEYYKSYIKGIGYNLTKGGEGGALVGDALERMKKSRKGQKPSKETLEKRSKALKGKLSGEKNPNYGKKVYNSGKSLEECFGEQKAKEIRKKLSLSIKEGQIKSEKMNKRREEIKQKYYKHPNYCTICGKMIEYEIGYKHKRCKKCRYKYKGETE